MAAAFNPTATELENLLECGICLNRFQDPRVLPCLHSYCLECLKSHVSSRKDEDGAFNCPQCREACVLPDGGVDKFPKNFFVNTMKDVLPESILQEPPLKASKYSGPIMCKHHDEESGDEHGEAVTFCVQCDAHFCQLCTKHHGMFIKDHKVTLVGDTDGTETNPRANCILHQNLAINWYCQSCSLPVCAECLAEKHRNHNSEKLENVEAALKLDMLDVSQMAAKRIDAFQKLSSEIRAGEIQMEGDLDKVSKDISDTADSLCRLIRQHENTLQDELKQVREKAMKKFEKAEEDLQRRKDNLVRLKLQADALQQAPSEQALCTVLQAQVTKRQYLHQQDAVVSSVQWSLEKQLPQPGKVEESTFLGTVTCNMSKRSKTTFEAGDVPLGSPLQTTQLDYKGGKAICSITPIYKSMMCVTHFYENEIWVYSGDGKLQKKVNIPSIESITGMVAVDEKTGKLAVVDGEEPKIHFVSLSEDLSSHQHVIKEISITPFCVSLNSQRHLVVGSRTNGEVVVLSLDGQIKVDIKTYIPHRPLDLIGIQHTKSGFVIFCDLEGKKVYFANQRGHILHTSTDCTKPWHVIQTSWGHILVADSTSGSICIFSEGGELLGRAQDSINPFMYPYFLHVNEADNVLYVGCGPTGKHEVRRYRFVPGDLPLLPVTQNICDISVNVQLNTI